MATMTETAEQYPPYLDALEIGDERTTRAKLEKLEEQVQALTKALEEARRAKRVLYVSGEDLREELIRFFADDLRLDAHESDGPGLFWLVDGDETDWCLCEVKESTSGNATKEHLAHVTIHRSTGERGDDTPALLIVNTFSSGETIEERDQAIPPGIAKRASEDHIVVVRTLDLVRLRQRASNGFPAGEQLAEALRSGGGWFEVDDHLNAGLHDGERKHSLQSAGSR